MSLKWIVGILLCCSTTFAQAQNLLNNPGFENGGATNGSNWVAANSGPLLDWITNGSTNVVQVDGSGPYTTYNTWLESDASGNPAGQQRYVDFGSTTQLAQTFVPPCTALYSFGASFSNWSNQPEQSQGQAEIFSGGAVSGLPVAQSNLLTFPGSSMAPWTNSAATVMLAGGQPYTFNVNMSGNYGVVDQTFVERASKCDLGPPKEMEGDHYQCYRLEHAEMDQLKIESTDQFGSVSEYVVRPVRICNPAVKTYKGVESKVADPERHYVCYQVDSNDEEVFGQEIEINNQFGPMRLKVDKRGEFCVPSHKRHLN